MAEERDRWKTSKPDTTPCRGESHYSPVHGTWQDCRLPNMPPSPSAPALSAARVTAHMQTTQNTSSIVSSKCYHIAPHQRRLVAGTEVVIKLMKSLHIAGYTPSPAPLDTADNLSNSTASQILEKGSSALE